MGIFSLFGKKDRQPAKPADKGASRSKSSTTKPRPDAGKSNTKPPTVKRDAQTALQTALKIDAIESEMSYEFVSVQTTAGPKSKPASVKPASSAPVTAVSRKPLAAASKPATESAGGATVTTLSLTLQPLQTGLGSTTEFLLDGQTAVRDIASPSSEAVAVIEEAAIMFANGQTDMVEHMLHAAIAADDLGGVVKTAWLMLLDLYQIVGKQQEFENLAIEYANKFETSPPAWHGGQARATAGAVTAAGTTPMVPFNAKLDASCIKQIERIQKLAENFRTLRLEFVRVTEVNAVGCGLLLGILRKLQKSGHDLILVGAPELTDKIRVILEVGRRDDTEDAWLLLLEVLRLLNREKEFEEISIDYCVTFEVSPPAFTAPQNKITTAAAESMAATQAEGFMMPAVIEGRIDELIVAIATYSDDHDPAIIDCSRLNRIDFNAAGRLLTGLSPFCGNGKSLEFHHVNQLVLALLNVIGLKDIARILPRRD